jgi:hypothetical protein
VTKPHVLSVLLYVLSLTALTFAQTANTSLRGPSLTRAAPSLPARRQEGLELRRQHTDSRKSESSAVWGGRPFHTATRIANHGDRRPAALENWVVEALIGNRLKIVGSLIVQGTAGRDGAGVAMASRHRDG